MIDRHVRDRSRDAHADDAGLLAELADGRVLGCLARVDPPAWDCPQPATRADEHDLDAG